MPRIVRKLCQAEWTRFFGYIRIWDKPCSFPDDGWPWRRSREIANKVGHYKQTCPWYHSMTKQIEAALRFVNERIVMVKHKGEPKLFQALRYEDDGNKCVVKGPISMTGPRNFDEEETVTIESEEIIRFAPGTPVICNGLKLASVLNNKIGYVLGWSEPNESDIAERVRFEDKEQGTAPVRAKFLRILFELPGEE